MAKSKFEQKRVQISSLIENPRNPRSHPEEQLAGLRASFKRFGQTKPILVRADNSMIIAGHGTRKAMELEGAKEIDVVLWHCDQKTADAFMVADNRLPAGAVDDIDRLAEILKEQSNAELAALGFDAESVASLFGDADEKITVEEIQTGTVQARFWITIRGPLKDQAKSLKRLKDAMKDLPEVHVDLGTVMEG